ncbi:MAG: dockerin type I repeat-containing protein [bacterium]
MTGRKLGFRYGAALALCTRLALAAGPPVELRAVGAYPDPHEITVPSGTPVRLLYAIGWATDLAAFQNSLSVTGDATDLEATSQGTWWGSHPATSARLEHQAATGMHIILCETTDPPWAHTSAGEASLLYLDLVPRSGTVVVDLLSRHQPQAINMWMSADPASYAVCDRLAIDLDASAPTVTIHVVPAGHLDIDTEVLVSGKLNLDGPAPKSLGIHGITLDGVPPDAPIAIQVGTDPAAGWLRLVDSGGRTDVFPDGDSPEGHLGAEWAGKRLRGLEPDTAYTFYAQALTDDGPTPLVHVGTYTTNRAGDVNRSGRATALDYAYIKSDILAGHTLGVDQAWPCDVDDSGAVNVGDLAETRWQMLQQLAP